MELNLFCGNVRICFDILESIEIRRNIGTAQNALTYVMQLGAFFEEGYYSHFQRKFNSLH